MLPVRLDPWQNIVGVGWRALMVAGDSRGFRNLTDAADLTLAVPPAGPGPAPAPGDLLIAHCGIRASRLPGGADDENEIVLSPPAGWTELAYGSVFVQFNFLPEAKAFNTGGGLWFRYIEAGDPSSWSWTQNDAVAPAARTGTIVRVTGARTSGFPLAWSLYVDLGLSANADPLAGPRNDPPLPVTLPGITPGVTDSLLLAFANKADTEFNSSWGGGGFTGLASVQTNGAIRNCWQRAFHKAWPGPGATGDYDILVTPRDSRAIAFFVAIAPK